MPRPFRLALCTLALLLSPLAGAQAQGSFSSLPEMGDRSTTVLTTDTSEQIGRAMMKQLQRAGKLHQDPLIEDYIQRLGRDLAAAGMVGEQAFHFFVVNERSINAFAMPGGYIGVHAGLILASHTESELAAVIAHEIAHVTQHHIARSVEKAKQMNLPLTAAVIAAILLGAADPEMGNAALAASLGVSSQMQIDFTRANEKEADRVGMQLLASAGFEPRGMADFFLRLQQDSRFASDSVPDFLRTHPVSTERMAEAQERASRYPPIQRADSISYQLIRARLLAQHHPADTLRAQLQQNDSRLRLDGESRDYLRALLHQQAREHQQAASLFEQLLQQAPERIAYVDGMGQLEIERSRFIQATNRYREGLEYYPGNEILTLGLSQALMAEGKHTQAKRELQRLLNRASSSIRATRMLAQVEAELGNTAASHIALAEYYLLLDEPHSAREQLQTARRQHPLDEYHAARIDARMEQVERLLK